MPSLLRCMSLLLALFGHATISELSLLSGVKRKLDFEPAKGSFWRKAVIRQNRRSCKQQPGQVGVYQFGIRLGEGALRRLSRRRRRPRVNNANEAAPADGEKR